MKSEALKFFTDTHWTAFALLLFFGFFTVLIYRVCFTKFSRALEQKKNLVFESGDGHEQKN